MSVILGRLSGAFLLNCELFALTLLFALPLGLVVAFGSMSRCRLLSGAVKTFVWVIRGTPLMLQIIVHCYDKISANMRKTAQKRRMLPKVSCHLYNSDSLIFVSKLCHYFE